MLRNEASILHFTGSSLAQLNADNFFAIATHDRIKK